VIFADSAAYDRVWRSGALSREAVCRIFGIAPDRITNYVEFDPALAIKFAIRRLRPSGSPGDGDVFGSQQYGPLLDLEVPPCSEGGLQQQSGGGGGNLSRVGPGV